MYSITLHGMFYMGRACMLQAVFAAVEGPENVFLWRATGAALLTVGTVTTYTLKVCPQG